MTTVLKLDGRNQTARINFPPELEKMITEIVIPHIRFIKPAEIMMRFARGLILYLENGRRWKWVDEKGNSTTEAEFQAYSIFYNCFGMPDPLKLITEPRYPLVSIENLPHLNRAEIKLGENKTVQFTTNIFFEATADIYRKQHADKIREYIQSNGRHAEIFRALFSDVT